VTGYMPILPVYFREKALALTHGGNLNSAYADGGATVFQPGLLAKATSEALTAAAGISESIERQAARLGTANAPAVVEASGGGCEFPWQQYCDSVAAAVDFALDNGKDVIFVTQPYLTGENEVKRHRWQQEAVTAMLRARYAGRNAVHLVNLGDAIDLRDTTFSFDGMHLTPQGNAVIAERLTGAVLEAAMARRRQASR
jgi:hypothetical protein